MVDQKMVTTCFFNEKGDYCAPQYRAQLGPQK